MPQARLVPRKNERLRIVRIGHKETLFSDAYVQLLAMPWSRLIFLIVGMYVLSNLIFANIYYLNLPGINGARPGSYQDVFFFSIQTMSTIGYGHMSPASLFVNIITSIEALWGFCYFATTTALLFARFSHPTSRVTFSDVAVIGPDNGKTHLSMRLANQRNNRIVNPRVELFLLRSEKTEEGRQFRRFYDLKLVRNHVPLMQMTWSILHPIDEQSPLFGITQDQLREMEAEIIISLTGMDETLSQTIHTRHSYIADEIICNAVFEDVLHRREDGVVQVNFDLFHTVKPIKDGDG